MVLVHLDAVFRYFFSVRDFSTLIRLADQQQCFILPEKENDDH